MKKIIGIVLCFICVSANAYNVTYSAPGVVTAIGGLDIGGEIFNVDFNEPDGFDVYGGDYAYFDGDEEGVTAAVEAINSVLSDVSAIAINGEGGGFVSAIYIVFNSVDGSLGGDCCDFEGNWQEYFPEFDGQNRAAFSVASTVPVPAAVWLFGSGLGLLGLVRRKKLALA